MKKSLVALAALAVIGAASAQSSVTLYGYGDMGIGQSVGTGEKSQFNPKTADVGGVRIGMKGTEDLGGGLKANFQLESNAYDEAGNGSGFNRATWFSISGGFGEVRLGRQARNSVVAGALASPAGWRGTDPEAAVGLRYSIENNTGGSSRISSLVNYITPTMGGFNARIGYAMAADDAGGKNNGAVTDLGLFYANGPLSLSFGYIKAENSEANQGFHAKYDFGTFALMGSYNDRGALAASAGTYAMSTTTGVIAITPSTVTAAVAAQKGFTLGATVPMGATTIFATYAKNNDAATKTSAYELGLDYALSKRTALTAFLANTDGLDMGYYAGVRHSF
jgi:predicted porin